MYIKDMQNGTVRKYGSDHHDSLQISEDGRTLSYENLQNGDDSRYGDYRFVTSKDGKIPSEDDDLVRHGADAYFNIGGFGNSKSCENCKYGTKLYVPPCDCFKDIPKDSFVCTVFLNEANRVQYLDNDQGTCEMWTRKGSD